MTALSAIGYCVDLRGEDLNLLMAALTSNADGPLMLEIATDADGARFKVDWGIWSPPMGIVTGVPER